MLKETFKLFSYPNVFSSKECRKIIKALDRSQRMQDVGYELDAAKAAESGNEVREPTSTMVHSDETEFTWIRERILRYCNEANEFYRANTTNRLTDDLQFLRYGPGGHFHRRCDNDGSGHIALREITAMLQLSSEREYQGGEFLLQSLSQKASVAPKQQGSLVVFQSCLHHQVLPVTKGVRYVMLARVDRNLNFWDKLRRRVPNTPPTPPEDAR